MPGADTVEFMVSLTSTRSLADVDVLMRKLGGVADRSQLDSALGRAAVDRALRDRAIVRTARGRYATPNAPQHLAAAHALAGTLSHLSAAQHWGWPVKTPPARPVVTVAPSRHLSPERRAGVDVHWRNLHPSDVIGGVTRPAITVFDCIRSLPFDEALTVADSALRSRLVLPVELLGYAGQPRSRGMTVARRVVAEATDQSSGPIESVLRAIALDVPGLRVVPQVVITDSGFFAVVDLADEALRIVLEAEGFEFHGQRGGLVRDCERYDFLAARGWIVLRFTWEHIMHHPDWVRETIRAAVMSRRGRVG